MARMRGDVESKPVAKALPESVNLDFAMPWLAERAALEESMREQKWYGM